MKPTLSGRMINTYIKTTEDDSDSQKILTKMRMIWREMIDHKLKVNHM